MDGLGSLLAAVVAGVLGLAGVVMAARAQRRVQSEADLRVRELEEFRRQLDQADRARLLVDRYQEPLVRAAYDLQSRLWNILRQAMLAAYGTDRDSPDWRYARESTAWLFGQYFGWVEIIRREVQYLRLPDYDERRRLTETLDDVAHVCSSDAPGMGAPFQVYRSQQRALGELMIVDGHDAEGNPRTDCMGFAAFTAALANPEHQVSTWFAPLIRSVEVMADSSAPGTRITELQHALMDLVDLVDHNRVRFGHHRERA